MTPQSNDAAAALAAGNERLKALAIGEAAGDANMSEFFVTLAEQIGDGVRDFDCVGPMYAWRYDVMNAEKARRGREVTPMPSGNSLSSQLTKAKTIAQLGMYERDRTGTIAVLRTIATVPGCQWKYKPLIVAANAIAETLDAFEDASDDQLRDAAQEAIDNIEGKVKTTSGELAKLAKAFDKLREDAAHGKVITGACASPDTDADVEHFAEELRLLINAVVAHEAKAGGKRRK